MSRMEIQSLTSLVSSADAAGYTLPPAETVTMTTT